MVELVVVASIAAVVTGVAVTSVASRAPAHRLEQAQWRLMSDLRAARMAAVAQGARCTITINASGKSYSIWLDANHNGSTDAGELTTKTLGDLSGVSMFNYPSTGTFAPGGTYSCSYYYTYVGVYSSAGTRYVYVFPSGQVDAWN